MKRFAIVNNQTGDVVNVIEYGTAPIGCPPGFEGDFIALESETASPGWVLKNGVLSDPRPPAPKQAPPPEPTLQEKLASIGLTIDQLKEALK